MARTIEKVTADRLEIRQGGGVGLTLFGLPFFTVGILAILVGLGLIPTRPADLRESSWLASAFFGTVFTAVGGAVMFGRSWTILDTAQRTLVWRLGLLRPMWQRTQPLEAYSAVALGFTRGDSDTADSFPVTLTAEGRADTKVCSFSSYAEARACAAAVAEHLHIQLEDASTDHTTRLSPSEAALSFRDRVRREGPHDSADPPPDLRSRVSRDADEVRITLPVARVHPLRIAVSLTPLALPLMFGASLSWLRQPAAGLPLPILLFFGLFVFLCVVLPVMSVLKAILRSRLGATIVTASPRGIQVDERGVWRTRRTASLDAADILDVDYSTRASTIAAATRAVEQRMVASGGPTSAIGPTTARLLLTISKLATGQGITIKGRQGFTNIGRDLPDDELRYLHSVIRQALRG